MKIFPSKLELTLEEAKALWNFLKYEYIGEKEYPGARDVVRKISDFLKNELA
jgi:hypothetical protein